MSGLNERPDSASSGWFLDCMGQLYGVGETGGVARLVTPMLRFAICDSQCIARETRNGRTRSVVCPPATFHSFTRLNRAANVSFISGGTTPSDWPWITSSGSFSGLSIGERRSRPARSSPSFSQYSGPYFSVGQPQVARSVIGALATAALTRPLPASSVTRVPPAEEP